MDVLGEKVLAEGDGWKFAFTPHASDKNERGLAVPLAVTFRIGDAPGANTVSPSRTFPPLRWTFRRQTRRKRPNRKKKLTGIRRRIEANQLRLLIGNSAGFGRCLGIPAGIQCRVCFRWPVLCYYNADMEHKQDTRTSWYAAFGWESALLFLICTTDMLTTLYWVHTHQATEADPGCLSGCITVIWHFAWQS